MAKLRIESNKLANPKKVIKLVNKKRTNLLWAVITAQAFSIAVLLIWG
jgi:hypothetical protein